jgi:hypothetical protein
VSIQPTALFVIAVWLAALASACERAPARVSVPAPAVEAPIPKEPRLSQEDIEAFSKFHLRLKPYLTKTPPEIDKLQHDREFCSQMGELCSIRLENAEADAERALKAGDVRILGVSDYSTWFPGMSREDQYAVSLYRRVEGTSDAVQGEPHADLIEHATDYAVIYNQFIIMNRDKYR